MEVDDNTLEGMNVLIETLWNVKLRTSICAFPGAFPRINRNIVECKVQNHFVRKRKAQVLIETLWNVKLHLRHLLMV